MPLFAPKVEVELRAVWPHEAHDFTPWLAENLFYLAEPLRIELELEATEKRVGAFRADIVCRNKEDNSRVVIENQLENSNHLHLGKVLTYAAGLDAGTIIWIAKKFRDEHRHALEWLNRKTDRGARFFGVMLKVCQVDEFYVPEFTVVTDATR